MIWPAGVLRDHIPEPLVRNKHARVPRQQFRFMAPLAREPRDLPAPSRRGEHIEIGKRVSNSIKQVPSVSRVTGCPPLDSLPTTRMSRSWARPDAVARSGARRSSTLKGAFLGQTSGANRAYNPGASV
jgi:hypothetical protein